MHRSSDIIAGAIRELMGFLNDPRQDWRMMAEAGLDLDSAFLPVLARLGAVEAAGVVELADQVGRDHSTISRQLARLEAAGLVTRETSAADGRARTARLTAEGQRAVAALSAARIRLLDQVMADWPASDCEAFGRLLRRFTVALKSSPAPEGRERAPGKPGSVD